MLKEIKSHKHNITINAEEIATEIGSPRSANMVILGAATPFLQMSYEELEKGIKQILCKIKHPQSNGKVEKWFDTYDNHRYAFKTKEEFIKWYNEVRPHRSLNFEILETPQQAFIRKMKAEV